MTGIVPYSVSAIVRVHTALNGWFRVHGSSPSYREISLMAHVHVGRVRHYLDSLQLQGVLAHQRGQPRSIVMANRMANMSDIELELECLGRSWTVTKPQPMASAIFNATYPVVAEVMDGEAALLNRLDSAQANEVLRAPR